MTDERLFERLASHVGPADVDAAFEDRLYALLHSEIRRSERPPRRALLLVAALAAIVLVSAAIALGSGIIELPNPTPDLTVSPTPSAAPSAVELTVTRMPGTRSSPAGLYGTVVTRPASERGASRGMHNVVEMGTDFRQTQLTFSAKDDCFVGAEGPEPVRMTVAGIDGLYVEPYDDPSVQFVFSPDHVTTTAAYALPVGDQTLCVYLSWDADTTAEELDAARQVVESIRAQATGEDRIWINFTLPSGWDTG
jgi:hypothetical protein